MNVPEVDGRPIEKLIGTELNGRWKIVELLRHETFQTGSCFSVGYKVVDKNGMFAYAKIMDFSRALQEDDTVAALKRMTESYIFERELLKLCDGYKLTKVIRGLDYGETSCEGVPLGRLYFLILEISEEGDIRKYINTNGSGPLSWRLFVLQDIATGLRQLHGREIYHQDVKPSNVLIFEDKHAKVGDLGRAHCQNLAAPHDGLFRPGAFHYAPPEQLYDFPVDNHLEYRLAAELYLLGSMLDFFITETPTTVRLVSALKQRASAILNGS